MMNIFYEQLTPKKLFDFELMLLAKIFWEDVYFFHKQFVDQESFQFGNKSFWQLIQELLFKPFYVVWASLSFWKVQEQHCSIREFYNVLQV